jgi:copper chaperone CopZ
MATAVADYDDLATVACAHCGAPAAAVDEPLAFCCAGCAVVYRAIARQRPRRLLPGPRRRGAGAHHRRAPTPSSTTTRSERLHARDRADGTRAVTLYLEDLRCAGCVWLVEATPGCVDGVAEVRVDVGRGRCDVAFDPAVVPLSQIARHLDRLGHPVHPYRGVDRDRARRHDDRAALLRLGVAGAGFGNLMLLAVALYAGWFEDMSVADDRRVSLGLDAARGADASATPRTPFWRAPRSGRCAVAALTSIVPLAIGIAVGLMWGSANVIRDRRRDLLRQPVDARLPAAGRRGGSSCSRHQRRASTAAELLWAL